MKAAGFMDLIEHGVCHLGFYGCIGTFVQLEGARIEAKPARICEQCTAKYSIHFSQKLSSHTAALFELVAHMSDK